MVFVTQTVSLGSVPSHLPCVFIIYELSMTALLFGVGLLGYFWITVIGIFFFIFVIENPIQISLSKVLTRGPSLGFMDQKQDVPE